MMYTSSVLALAALTASAAAQSAQTTISALLGPRASLGVAGSIIDANNCATTLALECTNTLICTGTADPTITVTQGPLFYNIAYSTSVNGASGAFSEYCTLSGPVNAATSAVCSYYLTLSAPGTSTSSSTVSTLAQSNLNYGALAITAGASKLSAATGSCTSTAPPAQNTSKSKGAAAAPTAMLKEVYKIVVPIAAGVIALV